MVWIILNFCEGEKNEKDFHERGKKMGKIIRGVIKIVKLKCSLYNPGKQLADSTCLRRKNSKKNVFLQKKKKINLVFLIVRLFFLFAIF